MSIGILVGDIESSGGETDASASTAAASDGLVLIGTPTTVAVEPAVTVADEVDDDPVAVENLDDGALGATDEFAGDEGLLRSTAGLAP